MDELVRLHSIYLNYGDGIRPHFQAVLQNPATVALKYVLDQEIVGILIYAEGISLSGPHPELIERIRTLANGAKVYTGDAVLVSSRCRGMGVADALYRRASALLEERGTELMLHELWVYPNGSIPSRPVLKFFGPYLFLGQFEGFYKDFYHYGYVCPICGEHCICAAELYLSRLKGDSVEWNESDWA
ncbi:hypothetical protein SDC9_192958 [bioreactor metagenome]|uniref:N-acetyltransferase domain-containing protein n=1 Tax=bioreactor metagenome TaxID=1076179 RepID=A0A645I264_9ZZZZ